MKVNSYIMSTTGLDDPSFADLYVMHGKSAYQAAVEQGFEGTEEEWLLSLCELRFGSLSTFSDNLATLLYVDTENDQIYRYDSATAKYKAIGAPLGETEKTAYRGDRGKIAYDHSISDHDYLHRNGGTMLGTINSMDILPKESLKYTLGSASMLYNALYINKVYAKDIEVEDNGIKTRIMARGDIATYLDATAEWRRGRYIYSNSNVLITAFDVYGHSNNDWDYWTIRDGNSGRDLFEFSKTGQFHVNYSSNRSVKIGNDVSFIDTITSESSASARGLTWTRINSDGSSTRVGTIGKFTSFNDIVEAYFYMGMDYSLSWIRVYERSLWTRNILPFTTDGPYNIGASDNKYANVYATTFHGSLKGNADTATALQTGRTLTLGLTGKNFDGTKDLSWTLAEIGALPVSGGIMHGRLTLDTDEGESPLTLRRLTSTGATEYTDIYQNDHGLVFDVINDESAALVTFNLDAKDIENSDGSNAVNGTIVLGITTGGHTYINASNFNGLASSAVKLNTPRTINGTSFDGTGNIITQTWGTSRNITISDADGTNKGTAVSVNGSEDEILPLPSTIKATLVGNASSATKLATARTIAISGKVTGTATSFNGTENISIPITAIDPSGVTQTSAYRFVSDTQISDWNAKPTKAEMDAAIAGLAGTAPELLNTLDELAAALGDDPNFATTMANSLATKLPLAGGTMTGTITSQNVIPGTNNTYTIGSSSYVYKGIYATTFYGALSGNASSATKLATARNFNVTDYSGTNAGAAVSFDGTAAVTMKLPDTIKATSFVGALTGNASTASSAAKLTTAVNINGTAFDGSKAITTANWGTARDITIKDADGTNVGTAVSVNGSAAVALLLPATIKATLSGNASSATKLATARNLNVADYSGTNAGAAVSFNGTAAITLKLPDTIKATSFVGTLTGNADTASKWATARTITLSGSVTGSVSIDGSGNVTLKTSTNHTHSYLPLTGGTLTGALIGTSATFSSTLDITGRLNANGRMSLPTIGGNWISGMILSNAAIDITTQNSENSYHPIIAGKTYDGNFWNLGTIKEAIGFVGFLKGRTENERDTYMLWQIKTGELQVSGAVTASSFIGSGTLLTGLNASNISSGTLNAARLATSGATAGSYGPSANASPAHNGSFSVPYVTVDKYGRVTAISTKTITLPGSGNTDTKVTQTESTTSNFRPLILGASYAADATTIYGNVTDQVYMGKGLYACPSTASIYASTFVGALSGNATSATKLATARKLTIGATGKNFDGTAAVSWSLAEIGAAAASHTHSYAGSSSAGGAATTALACTGNAATATKLATARTITLTGSVTGSVSFDGSGNVSIATTTNHTHSYLALSGGTLTGTLTSRAIAPSADNTYALGTSTMRFSNIYAATFTGALSGNASSATKLATARTLTIGSKGKTFDGSGNVSWTLAEIGAAAASHSHSEYASTSHTHNYAGSSSAGGAATTALALSNAKTISTVADLDAFFTASKMQYGMLSKIASGLSGELVPNNDGPILSLPWSSTSWGQQLFFDDSSYGIAVRFKNNGTWQPWVALLNTNNYKSYVTPANIGAAAASHSHSGYAASSHTHNYAGSSSAGGVANSAAKLSTARTLTIGATGKTFDGSGNVSWTLAEIGAAAASHTHSYAASSHTHNYAGSSSAGGVANSALKLTGWADTRDVNTTPNTYNAAFIISGLKTNSKIGIDGNGIYSSVIGFRSWSDSSGGNAHEIAFTGDGQILRRHGATTSWNNWACILDSANFADHVTPAKIGAAAASHTHSYASTSHTHNYAGSSSAGGDATNALKLGGASADTSASNNTIAKRTSSGYLYATYLNQSSSAETPTTSSYIMYTNSDGFLRKSSLANIKSILGLGTAAYTASTAYAAASHSHSYLPLTGGILTGMTTFGGGTYNSDPSSRWGTSAIQVRENGLVGTAQSNNAYAPAIGFHWSGRTAGQLCLESNGYFAFVAQDGSYAPLNTGRHYVSGGLYLDACNLMVDGGIIQTTGGIEPYNDGWGNSGSTTKRWGSVYTNKITNVDQDSDGTDTYMYSIAPHNGVYYAGDDKGYTLKIISATSRYYTPKPITFVTSMLVPAGVCDASLGSSSYKWKNVYCSAGAFNGSDRKIKKDINYDIDDRYLYLFDNLKIASFKYKDGTSNRTHIGIIAQDLLQSMNEVDMDTKEFAGIGIDRYMQKEDYSSECKYYEINCGFNNTFFVEDNPGQRNPNRVYNKREVLTYDTYFTTDGMSIFDVPQRYLVIKTDATVANYNNESNKEAYPSLTIHSIKLTSSDESVEDYVIDLHNFIRYDESRQYYTGTFSYLEDGSLEFKPNKRFEGIGIALTKDCSLIDLSMYNNIVIDITYSDEFILGANSHEYNIYTEMSEEERRIYMVRWNEISALNVLKTQNNAKEIESLKSEIDSLKTEIESLKSLIKELTEK